MTRRQQLIETKREALQLMKHHELNKHAMGNMYWYWKDKWESAKVKLERKEY